MDSLIFRNGRKEKKITKILIGEVLIRCVCLYIYSDLFVFMIASIVRENSVDVSRFILSISKK